MQCFFSQIKNHLFIHLFIYNVEICVTLICDTLINENPMTCEQINFWSWAYVHIVWKTPYLARSPKLSRNEFPYM